MPNWRILAAVTVGGGLGSAARLLLGMFIQQRVPFAFPAGTFVINVTGSFLIGIFTQIGRRHARLQSGGALLSDDRSVRRLHDLLDVQLRDDPAGRRRPIPDGRRLYRARACVLSLIACVLGIAAARGMLAWRRT